MAVAKAASTLRPVKRSSPTAHTAQSRTPGCGSGAPWMVAQYLQARTCVPFTPLDPLRAAQAALTARARLWNCRKSPCPLVGSV